MIDIRLNRIDPDSASVRSVDVVICRLRRRLRALPFLAGVSITTDWGEGYYIDRESCALLVQIREVPRPGGYR